MATHRNASAAESAAFPKRFVVGLSGASGCGYARGVIAALAAAGYEVHVTISEGFFGVARVEEDDAARYLSPERVDLAGWTGVKGEYRYHRFDALGAPISSGGFRARGMIVAPCSVATLGNIANGTGKNLVERAAEVTMKEGRKLAILLRESPLSPIALENALKLARLGVHILPTSPGFYFKPLSVQEIIDYTVARTLDLFDVPHDLGRRWGESGM